MTHHKLWVMNYIGGVELRGEYKEINRKIGARIRLARETAGLTRDEFSEKIGISAQFQTDIERGRTGPSITTLCKICDVLAVPTDSILRGPQPGVEAAAWQIGTLLRDVPPEFLPLIIENIREQTKLIELALQAKGLPADKG